MLEKFFFTLWQNNEQNSVIKRTDDEASTVFSNKSLDASFSSFATAETDVRSKLTSWIEHLIERFCGAAAVEVFAWNIARFMEHIKQCKSAIGSEEVSALYFLHNVFARKLSLQHGFYFVMQLILSERFGDATYTLLPWCEVIEFNPSNKRDDLEAHYLRLLKQILWKYDAANQKQEASILDEATSIQTSQELVVSDKKIALIKKSIVFLQTASMSGTKIKARTYDNPSEPIDGYTSYFKRDRWLLLSSSNKTMATLKINHRIYHAVSASTSVASHLYSFLNRNHSTWDCSADYHNDWYKARALVLQECNFHFTLTSPLPPIKTAIKGGLSNSVTLTAGHLYHLLLPLFKIVSSEKTVPYASTAEKNLCLLLVDKIQLQVSRHLTSSQFFSSNAPKLQLSTSFFDTLMDSECFANFHFMLINPYVYISNYSSVRADFKAFLLQILQATNSHYSLWQVAFKQNKFDKNTTFNLLQAFSSTSHLFDNTTANPIYQDERQFYLAIALNRFKQSTLHNKYSHKQRELRFLSADGDACYLKPLTVQERFNMQNYLTANS